MKKETRLKRIKKYNDMIENQDTTLPQYELAEKTINATIKLLEHTVKYYRQAEHEGLRYGEAVILMEQHMKGEKVC